HCRRHPASIGRLGASQSKVPGLPLGPDETRDLVDLGDHLPGLRMVLDRPNWFTREGQLALNLFTGPTRVFTLAFALRLEPDLTAYVGALQGRSLDGVLDTYRELTRALHDMRPRDFLVEVFRALGRAVGVRRILAVSDACRHHRSPYFRGKSVDGSLNYDEVWRERGGRPLGDGFFELPVEAGRRAADEIPARKRSMYRKRYALLDRIEAELAVAVGRPSG
ncbi:MAG: VirK/YbjX family protein, partial [Gemmataceae bacterium]|nr:VirK/YbjX family protein [Gemmataceae bacterium]